MANIIGGWMAIAARPLLYLLPASILADVAVKAVMEHKHLG